MKVILLNLEEAGEHIMDMLGSFRRIRGSMVIFCLVTKEEEVLEMIRKEPDQSYLIFYRAVDVHSLGRLYSLAREKLLHIYLVAICSDFQQGIESMNAGDIYALKLPLKKEQVVTCVRKVVKCMP